MILDTMAGSQFSYAAGSAATVTVPSGVVVVSIHAHASAGAATLTITPKGANQTSTAGSAIPVPATDWLRLGPFDIGGQLGEGTVLVFAGTDSYFVAYAKLTS